MTLYLCPLVLEPYLNTARGHPKLVSQMNTGLLVRHLVSLKDLLQNGQLVRTGTLPLLLVEPIILGGLVHRDLHTMELKKNHSKEHDFSFFILIVIKTKIDNLLSVKCTQPGLQRSLLHLDVLQNKLTLKQDVTCSIHRCTLLDNLHWC